MLNLGLVCLGLLGDLGDDGAQIDRGPARSAGRRGLECLDGGLGHRRHKSARIKCRRGSARSARSARSLNRRMVGGGGCRALGDGLDDLGDVRRRSAGCRAERGSGLYRLDNGPGRGLC
ncbi:MAG TPA: hypothetical protein DDZ83_15030, partial [Nitrospinae bacterium]|nr:hypothetical protein [Nitrospinota bacterium]